MIGNDIVDLKQASIESNWRRKGYLEKIFTPAEQSLITSTEMPDILIWLFWSMKEAVYKIFSREEMLRSYAPARIACTVPATVTYPKARTSLNTIYGEVLYNDTIYLTRSGLNIEEQYIHTLAARNEAGLKNTIIEITSNDGLPYQQRNPASVSHHGRYLALAFTSNSSLSIG